jgi:Zn-dependent protease with chaperone function
LVTVFVSHFLSYQGSLTGYLGVVCAAGAFLATFRFLGRQSRQQEFEADSHSIEKLDTNWEDLASALSKIEQVNQAGLPIPLGTHPKIEFRIALLKARFEQVKKDEERAA